MSLDMTIHDQDGLCDMHLQDSAHRTLQSTIQRITSDQQHSQAVLQELSSQIAALGARAGTAASTSGTAAVPPATPVRTGDACCCSPVLHVLGKGQQVEP